MQGKLDEALKDAARWRRECADREAEVAALTSAAGTKKEDEHNGIKTRSKSTHPKRQRKQRRDNHDRSKKRFFRNRARNLFRPTHSKKYKQ